MKIIPMLGEKLSDYSDDILVGKLWRMSEKIDGVRRLILKDEHGNVSAESRTNHVDPWLTHIYEFLEAPWFQSNRVYDCELVDREAYYAGVPCFELRQISNSKASQQYPDNKKDLMAICFDMFQPGGDMRRAEVRDVELYSMFNRSRHDDPVIRVPIFGNIYGADMETLNKTMKSVTDRGGEGLMLLDMDSIYIPGRTKNLLKVKNMIEVVGRIIDVEIARPNTKIAGMVAAVIVEVPGCTIPVRVGSGFNDAERLEMMINSPIGRYIDIDAFAYSRNKKGTISLNLPIFKQFVA